MKMYKVSFRIVGTTESGEAYCEEANKARAFLQTVEDVAAAYGVEKDRVCVTGVEEERQRWVFDDGGREEAGFKGRTGDCACRAIAIATGIPYKEVYNLINEYGKRERIGKRKRGRSNARTGVYHNTVRRIMEDLGWTWVPTMSIGSGCTVHLRGDELPPGRILTSLSRHYAAVVDGVVHDTYDSTRGGERCVYGYFKK